MPAPIALCLEDLNAPEADPPFIAERPKDASRADRYLQCVAVEGTEPGLGLGADGSVLWLEVSAACELWVSLDGKLMLLRREGAPPVEVSRAGRRLDAPAEQPVVLRHGDGIALGGRRLQLHVHGEAPAISAPTPLRERIGRAAAALAVGALVGGVALPASADPTGGEPIEVRKHPPKIKRPDPPPDDTKKPDGKKRPDGKKKPSKKGEPKPGDE